MGNQRQREVVESFPDSSRVHVFDQNSHRHDVCGKLLGSALCVAAILSLVGMGCIQVCGATFYSVQGRLSRVQ